jgi:uncharacterized protein (DUF305 family)
MRHRNGLRRALIAGVAGTAALLLAAGCSSSGMGGMDHGAAATPTASAPAGAGFNDIDVMFAQSMIPHHQQAVEMATLAETRVADPELKALAAQIKAAQSPEIATMTGWLTTWGKPTAAPQDHSMPGMSMTMPGMMSADDMAKLKAATGAAFDLQFTRMMIAHHEGAIQMAKDEQANGSDAQAKALAAAIEKAQAAEVATLNKILSRL